VEKIETRTKAPVGNVTVSIGVAFKEEDDSPKEVLFRAEKATRIAKNVPRKNNFKFLSKDIDNNTDK